MEAKHIPRGESASTRIDALRPTCEGMSDAAMGNRAGFREARDLAAQIASEHDARAAEMLERAKIALGYLERGERGSAMFVEHAADHLRAAIAKATGGRHAPPQAVLASPPRMP